MSGKLYVVALYANTDPWLTGVPSGLAVNVPTQVGTKSDWVQIAQYSRYNPLALDSAGQVYTWGYDNGLGLTAPTTPTLSTVVSGINKIFPTGFGNDRAVYLRQTDGTLLFAGGSSYFSPQFGAGASAYLGAPYSLGAGYSGLSYVDYSYDTGILFAFANGTFTGNNVTGSYAYTRYRHFMPAANTAITAFTPTVAATQIRTTYGYGFALLADGSVTVASDLGVYNTIPGVTISKLTGNTENYNSAALTTSGALVRLNASATSTPVSTGPYVDVVMGALGYHCAGIKANGDIDVFEISNTPYLLTSVTGAKAESVTLSQDTLFYVSTVTPPPPVFWGNFHGTSEQL